MTIRALSKQESEVMRLSCAGLSSAEVAERLGTTPGLVRNKRHVAYQKLRVTTLEDACRMIVESARSTETTS